MALTTNDEAQAVNTLAHWLTGDPRPGFGVPTADEAGKALGLLMRGAYKKLMAGYSEEAISELWPGKAGSVAASLAAAEQARTGQAEGEQSREVGDGDD
jgi:hypothetical protein